MSNGFYPISNELLKLDIDYTSLDLGKKKNQNLLDVMFNHYVMKKENISRIQGELKTGHLELSTRAITKDFNITLKVASELVNRFIDRGILTLIHKSTKKGQASVYAYSTVINLDINSVQKETNLETNLETDFSSVFNGSRIQKETNLETDLETSKKENIKTKSKKLCKKESYKDIINRFTKDETIRELLVDFTNSMIIKNKTLTNRALKLHMKDLQQFSNKNDEVMIQIIENTIKNSYNAFYEPKSTYKNKGKNSFDNFDATYVNDNDLDNKIEERENNKEKAKIYPSDKLFDYYYTELVKKGKNRDYVPLKESIEYFEWVSNDWCESYQPKIIEQCAAGVWE